MTYDLALYPAPGPGLGHLMRCLALAQWAVELKAKVIVCLPVAPETRALPWPCPVAVGRTEGNAAVSVVDGKCHVLTDRHIPAWYFVDGQDWEHDGNVAGCIAPHFGAAPVHGFPTFVGPSWIPLRRQFSLPPAIIDNQRAKWGVTYRATRDGYHSLENRSAYDVFCALSVAREAVVPASTIAYEALTLGCPVRLLRGITPDCDRIGAAMVAEGVAVWDDDQTVATLPPMQVGDGLGAKRLLESLL